MKVTALFLTFLMLVLGLNFCAWADACNSKNKTEISKCDSNNTDNDGVCSPFCYCSNCPLSVLVSEEFLVSCFGCYVSKKWDDKLTQMPLKGWDSIWQPPKMV